MEIVQKTKFEDLIKSSSLETLIQQTEIEQSIIVYGATASGKTYFYTSLMNYYKKKGIKPENIAMIVIYPDRLGGVIKVAKKRVSPEYRKRIIVRPIKSGDFKEVIKETENAITILQDFLQKDEHNIAWLVIEMLGEMWDMAQDTAIRESYGIGIGEFMASKRKELMEKAQIEGTKEPSAYQAMSGAFGGEWVTIKNLHNKEWIDKLKAIPILRVNVLLTAEEKDTTSPTFAQEGKEPKGEKSNQHRFDTIIHLWREQNQFKMRAVKITGYSKTYGAVDVTGKIPFEEHLKQLKQIEEYEEKQKEAISQIQQPEKQPESQEVKKKEELEWV